MVVRDDLPRGVLAAQVVHAAGESSPGALPEHTHAVVLAAKHECQLLQVEEELLARSIAHVAIREPDAPWNGQLMAIGVVPLADRTKLQPITKKLRLLR